MYNDSGLEAASPNSEGRQGSEDAHPSRHAVHKLPAVRQQRAVWGQVAALERQLAANREAMEVDIRAKAAEAEALKGVVDELRNATSHTIAGSEAAILALQARAVPSLLYLLFFASLLCHSFCEETPLQLLAYGRTCTLVWNVEQRPSEQHQI